MGEQAHLVALGCLRQWQVVSNHLCTQCTTFVPCLKFLEMYIPRGVLTSVARGSTTGATVYKVRSVQMPLMHTASGFSLPSLVHFSRSFQYACGHAGFNEPPKVARWITCKHAGHAMPAKYDGMSHSRPLRTCAGDIAYEEGRGVTWHGVCPAPIFSPFSMKALCRARS